MADKLLAACSRKLVGKNQAERFVTYIDELKMAFNQVKDRQRIQQENPKVINAQFKLVKEIKAKYGVYISTQYKERDIPYNWKLLVSKNSQTNNALSIEQLKHFNARIMARQVKVYQLLILDSYKSYLNQNFKDYYLKNKILTLYIPAYLLYILQPLNIVYFTPLKYKYS